MELGIHVEEWKIEESDVPLSCRLTEEEGLSVP